ncbi:hypothetical protein SLA2020_425310 [Shorea laevis]
MEECLFASEKGPKVASGDLLGKDSSVTVGVMDQRCSDRGLESCLFGAADEGLGLQSGKLEKDEGFFPGSERDLGSLFGSERDDPWMPSLMDILLFVGSTCVSLEEVVEPEIMTGVFRYDGVAPNSSKLDEHADVLSLVLSELCESVGLGPKVYAEAKGFWLDGEVLRVSASPSF